MQIARTRVIAQTGPVMQHIIEAGIGQGTHIREGLHEAREVGNDRTHLGLLQHDLGDPHAIGVTRVLPGQIVAAVLVEPAQE